MQRASRALSILLPLAALLRALPASAAPSCNAGAQVLYAEASEGPFALAEVIARDPGEKVQIRLLAEGVAAAVGSELFVSPTQLTDAGGLPCARAALCFFGRVGNLEGKFDQGGSTRQVLQAAAPSILLNVIRANRELAWDIVAHTWDTHLVGAIKDAFNPVLIEAEPQPDVDNVHSFAESTRRSVALKSRLESQGKFRYDLVLLMRYDIYWASPLPIGSAVPTDRLWSGHWCSVHAEDYSLREVILNTTLNVRDFRSRTTGVFAPSQFVLVGLHDYWFAASSRDMDKFAQWGDAIDGLLEKFGLRSPELPEHFGHFYTFLYAKILNLKMGYTSVSYLDYRLVRHRECKLYLGDQVKNQHLFCGNWNILLSECDDWVLMPHGGALLFCPVAGRRAHLESGSRGCGKF